MATQTDKYLIEIQAKLIGDAAITTLTNNITALEAENKKLRQSFLALGGTMQNVNTQTKQMGAGMSRNQVLFNNISFQVTDFATQVQGGTSALRAMSQQLPQVAGALGAAGIGGGIGMAVFAIGSLVASMLPAIVAFAGMTTEAQKLDIQLQSISDRSIDVSGIFGAAKSATEDLKNLTVQGRIFADTIERIEETQRKQSLSILQKQLSPLAQTFTEVTKSVNDFHARVAFMQDSMDSGAIRKWEADIKDAFGVTAEEAKKLKPLIDEVINPSSDAAQFAALNQLLEFFSTANTDTEKTAKNVGEIKNRIEEIIKLNVQGGTFDLGGKEDKESLQILKRLNDEWKRLTESLRTSEEVFQDQIDRTRELGSELKKTPEQIQAVIDKLQQAREEDFLKKMISDANSFAFGIYEAQQALDKLNISADTLAGIRRLMDEQAIGSDEWVAIAKTLGDNKTNMEKILIAQHDVIAESKGVESLRDTWDAVKNKLGLTEEQMKKVEAQIFSLEKKSKDMLTAIGIAIGQTLSSQVSKFVDTLFDAKASFSDMARSMLTDIAKLIVQISILRSLESGLGPTSFGKWLGLGNAKGNVFSAGNVIPFARGGIVTAPAIFPMATGQVGLMGEAGPEAIMPLSRGADGKLGVKSQPVTVNVINTTDAKTTVKETKESGGGTRIDVMIESAVDSAIARGRFDKSLSNLYGLRRKGG